MQQSNFIFGALAVAFVVFVTTRGSLPAYMSVLFGTASAGGAAGPTTNPVTPEQQKGFDMSGFLPNVSIPGLQ